MCGITFVWDVVKCTALVCGLYLAMLASYMLATAISARIPPFLTAAVVLAVVVVVAGRLIALWRPRPVKKQVE